MSSRKCKYDADAFCFICGQFIKVRDVKYELKTSHVLCEAYEAYFDCPVRNQDKPWAPHVARSYCKRRWYRGEKRSMKFAIPRIWREPKDHITDCYFCMVNPSKRRRGKNAKPIEYPDLESSSAPIAHDLTRPVPDPPKKLSQKSSSSFSSYKSNSDKEFLPTPEQPKHYLITSEDFNDLIRDLNLPKNKAELLGSRLKQWNLLDDVKITDQRTRHEMFATFFTKEMDFVFVMTLKILADEKFPTLLNRTQKASWNSFKAVVSGFLGNNKAENYEKLVEDMLTNFKAMGCRMSLKVHMLHAHLDKFKNNMGAYSEDQGERFHQDIMNFEQRYQGQYNENMMGDYIWGLLRESSYEHKRKSKSVHF
ncbi:unnamed protein product [Pieris macdunnoughi]|uniref:Uncharacterized protein n=1 Tax=Pieris macdunnoughi TaxID=345717 RepID=A0A821Y300_9NEOP|nr:unnamed protein product [Pieris macdunnoughi]